MGSMGNILAGVVFGALGFGAWRWGRRRDSARHMLLGAALMGYTFLVPDTPLWTWGTGLALTLGCVLP